MLVAVSHICISVSTLSSSVDTSHTASTLWPQFSFIIWETLFPKEGISVYTGTSIQWVGLCVCVLLATKPRALHIIGKCH